MVQHKSAWSRKLRLESLESRAYLAGDLLSSAVFGTSVGGEALVDVEVRAGDRYSLMDLANSLPTIDLDPEHTYPDGRDIFTPVANNSQTGVAVVTKFDSQGLLVWKTQINGTAENMALDGAGNVFLTGYIVGQNVQLGASTWSTTVGFGDIFFGKLDATTGDWVFSKQVTQTSQIYERYSQIAVNSTGDAAYVSYRWNSKNSALTKFNVAGATANPAWTDSWVVSQGNMAIVDLAISGTQVVAVGNHSTEVDFDPGTGVAKLMSGSNKNASNSAGFVMSIQSNGSLSWAKNFRVGATGASGVNSVAIDANGIAVTGGFSGVVDFDPGAANLNLSSRGGLDAYFARLSPSGTLLSAQSFGSSLADSGRVIVSTGNGEYLIAGRTTNSDGAIVYSDLRKVNLAGSTQWVSRVENANVRDIAWNATTQQVEFVGSFYGDLYYVDSNGVRTPNPILRSLSSTLISGFWLRIAV